MHKVRQPAGAFYSGQGSVLAHDVAALLTAASAGADALSPTPKAIIVPHAGYSYAGATAALAYARLAGGRKTIRRVVLLGPVHRVPICGLALPGADAFATPLGEVDQAGVAAVMAQAQVRVNPAAHAQEHALEVQLPFLQRVLDDFKLTGSHLQPVLDTLVYLRHETSVWFEITTLLIPGHNDSDAEIDAMCRWLRQQLGPDVPLHFSAFHPDHKMPEVPATPAAPLVRARHIALQHGLHYAYTGNVHHIEGDTTYCPQCQAALIERDWHQIKHYRLTTDGHCPHCDSGVAGRFAARSGNFGRRRIPISIGMA